MNMWGWSFRTAERSEFIGGSFLPFGSGNTDGLVIEHQNRFHSLIIFTSYLPHIVVPPQRIAALQLHCHVNGTKSSFDVDNRTFVP